MQFFSLKSRKSRILQFLDQKVSNWHWLIFTSFGSLEYNLNFLKELCESALFLLCGFDESQFNKTMLETLTHHTPAGTSTRTVVHYGRNYGSEIIHWLCLKKLLRRTLISFRSNIRGSLLPYIWPPVCSYSVK